MVNVDRKDGVNPGPGFLCNNTKVRALFRAHLLRGMNSAITIHLKQGSLTKENWNAFGF